jgi:hypothetical protein
MVGLGQEKARKVNSLGRQLVGGSDAASSRRLQFTHRPAKIATPRIEYVDGEMQVSLTPASGVLRGLMGCRRRRPKCVSHWKKVFFSNSWLRVALF